MVMERRFCRGDSSKTFTLILILSFFLFNSCIFAAEQSTASGTVRHKFFSLKHISAQRGRQYLSELKLGTVSQIPNTNALLVTAQPDELAKAIAVLKVVDSKELFVVEKLAPASTVRNLPANEQIAAAVGSISIGSFANPPDDSALTKAIIDIHNNVVLTIAPVSKLQQIISVVENSSVLLADETIRNTQLPPTRIMEVPQAVELNVPKPSTEKETTDPKPLLKAQELRAKIAALQQEQQQQLEPNSQSDSQTESEHTAESTKTQPKFQPETEQQLKPEPVAEPKQEPAAAPVKEPDKKSKLKQNEVTVPENEADKTAKVTETAEEMRRYEPKPITNGSKELKLNLPEKLEVVDLLSLVGEYLGLTYMYDPANVKGEVTLKLHGKLRGDLRVEDLYPLLESVLKFKQLVMTRKGNLVTVVPVQEALDIDPALVLPEAVEIQQGDGIVTRVFELQHVSTDNAENMLSKMKLGVAISSIPETGTLIVTGYTYRMGRVEQLLEMIDKPGKPRKFRFRQLRYTMAGTLAPKIETLAEQMGTVSVTISEPEQPTVRPGMTAAQRRAAELAARRAREARARQQQAEPVQPSVYLDADERTNRILMIGLEEQLGLVEELIDALDVEQQDLRTLKLYKIEYMDAEEVKNKLQELEIIGGPAVTSSRITGAPAATSAQAQSAAARAAAARGRTAEETETEEALTEEPQVIVIETTNSLLVNGTAEQHTRIETIIKYVDRKTEEEEIPYKLYPLENQSPDHLAEVLNGLIEETVTDKEGKIERIVKKEEQITIVPDPNTFSLIVYASKKNQEWIANLIKQLDKRRPQVLIDVTLVQVSKTDEFSFDLDMISSFPDLTASSGLIGAIDPNIISNLAKSQFSQFNDLRSNKGVGTGYYGDKHINFLINAMQQKNYGRVLAKPKILVNDNATGTIQTTDTTYVTKKSSVPYISGAAGEQATVIETAVDYEGYDAGITLDITPHISEGDLLRLDITLTRSDFGTITGDKPPDTTTSEINTTVTVPNSSTIILGGMLKLNQSKGGAKVPILGDLPIVGGAFRTISDSDLQRKLYVFVKAEIIRPADTLAAGLVDLERISDKNRTAFERHEMEFQEYEGWPGIKPEPLDPVKVLEAH
jgi:general secretion pathway protein D